MASRRDMARLGVPVFEVDTKDLDKNRLHPIREINTPPWWVYQGTIPANLLTRIFQKVDR